MHVNDLKIERASCERLNGTDSLLLENMEVTWKLTSRPLTWSSTFPRIAICSSSDGRLPNIPRMRWVGRF